MSKLAVVFKYQEKNMTIQCMNTDTLNQIFNRYCTKANLERNDVKFYSDAKEIRGDDNSLDSHKIKNYHTFNVVMAKYVIGA